MKSTPKDLRHEIPARAFINAQIIQKALSMPEFERAIRSVLALPLYRSQGLTRYQFVNPAYAVALLYCLIVVPKELWAKSSDSKVYSEIEKQDSLSLFQILKESARPSGSPTYRLIYRLRNAVAHANFTVDEMMVFTFWDMPPKTTEREWEARIDAQGLMTFLSKVGSILANEGLTKG